MCIFFNISGSNSWVGLVGAVDRELRSDTLLENDTEVGFDGILFSGVGRIHNIG